VGMELGEETKDQVKSSIRRMSQGNVYRKVSEEDKALQKNAGMDKFMTKPKEKKSVDHLKLKLSSAKKS
jgi:hypothetical protein